MRQGSEISLLMCDVDHFKKYNDHYGHQAGDECLASIADIIVLASGRGGDSAARYGGEEFALILPETSLAGAQRIGQRILDRIAQEAMPHAESPLGRVSASIGAAAAVAMPETEPRSLIRAADAALYAAKAAGRNRVCIAVADGAR
jgi:diguanylate cyclase (GGDEF)-like protein